VESPGCPLILSFPFDNQEYGGRVTDIKHFVPGGAIADEATVCGHVDYTNSAVIGDLYVTTDNGVAEMRRMKMALMSNAWGKGTTQNSLPGIFVQSLTHLRSTPSGCQRIREP